MTDTPDNDPRTTAAQASVLLPYKVQRLEEEQRKLSAKIEKMEAERVEQEKLKMRAAAMGLGSLVLAMAGLIWWLLPPNVQHAWDLVRGNER